MIRALLSLLRGLDQHAGSYPQLALWAAFFRRFVAGGGRTSAFGAGCTCRTRRGWMFDCGGFFLGEGQQIPPWRCALRRNDKGFRVGWNDEDSTVAG